MNDQKVPIQRIQIGKNTVPAVIYGINDYQNLMIIGVPPGIKDFKAITPNGEPVTGTEYLGRLSEQATVFGQQCQNSLNRDDWPFTESPDPAVIVVTYDRAKVIPYGPAWETEVMKFKKIELVEQLRKALIENHVLNEKVKLLQSI